MSFHHVFKVDENHIGIKVSKVHSENYRFPIEMLASGQKFDGVETTLNKPHGKKVIMEFVIKALMKGPRQYNSFINQVLQNYQWVDVNDALEILLLDGIIQVVFKNQKPRKAIDWLPKVVQLDPKVAEGLVKKKADTNLEFNKLKESVISLLKSTTSPIKERVLKWIEEEEIKDQLGNVLAEMGSFKKYKSIVLTIAYYIHLKETGGKLPLRHLSNQIWMNSRVLKMYQNEIALSADITLKELNSILLPDINSTLNISLIFISPVEKLQKTVNELSSLIRSDIQKEKMLLCLNAIYSCIQEVNKINDNSSDDSYDFFSLYNLIKSEIRGDNFISAQLIISNDFEPLITSFKRQLLRIETVRQKYELIVLEKIGAGYFARVYKVFDPETQKISACKVLYPRSHFEVYGNNVDEYIMRFKREVKLLSQKLKHKNIIEVDKIQLEGASFWFTMPLAHRSLDEWMKENHAASEAQRMNIFRQILSGVKYLHEERKYHRDLAPSNILLIETAEGLEVKLADFGLAKDPEALSFFTGQSKRNYGQRDFTDPEQWNNLADSTNLSDIFSLGALLYYLLSNKLPKKRKYVRVKCQDVVMKAMDIRKRRYQTVYEFEEDLNKLIE